MVDCELLADAVGGSGARTCEEKAILSVVVVVVILRYEKETGLVISCPFFVLLCSIVCTSNADRPKLLLLLVLVLMKKESEAVSEKL